MKALLDTHTWLWMAADPDRLSGQVRALVAERGTTLCLSAASGWELALLWKLGRVGLPDHSSRFVPETCAKLDVAILPIHLDVAVAAATLPQHHRDPFDRILVATALLENLTLFSVTSAWTLTEFGVSGSKRIPCEPFDSRFLGSRFHTFVL